MCCIWLEDPCPQLSLWSYLLDLKAWGDSPPSQDQLNSGRSGLFSFISDTEPICAWHFRHLGMHARQLLPIEALVWEEKSWLVEGGQGWAINVAASKLGLHDSGVVLDQLEP